MGERADRAREERAARARDEAALMMTHPLRVRLIVSLKIESPQTADALAERIGEPPHRVRRHLNALVAAGYVGVAAEETRRGALQRYFEIKSVPRIDTAATALLSERDRRRAAVGTIRLILEEMTRAASNPRLGERDDLVVVNFPGRVDERGWRELSELHIETLERAERIFDESRERLAATGETPIGVISDQVLLEAPQHTPEPEA